MIPGCLIIKFTITQNAQCRNLFHNVLCLSEAKGMDIKMPKISIVLPTYNGEKYIRESIDSIIRQTFTDWELIIVNDCSTDGTQEIIDSYVKQDSRIKTIKNDINQKLPKSLNIGFNHVQGEYLTWTSDDNMYYPEALEVMNDYLNKNLKCPMVCSDMIVIDHKGEKVGDYVNYNDENIFLNNCVGASFMYRKNVLKDVGEYDPERFLVEDYDYWLRIIFRYGKLGYINRPLYAYRVHERSLTKQKKKDIQDQLIKLKENYIDEIIKRLEGRKDLISQIYYEMRKKDADNCKIKELCEQIIPEINKEISGTPTDFFAIYGAGTYGKNAIEKYKDRIVYIIDRNELLTGSEINGIKIISFKEFDKIKTKYEVMITVSPPNIYSCIKTLEMQGINKYYVYKN